MPRASFPGLDRDGLTAEERLVLALAAPERDFTEIDGTASACDAHELFALAHRHNLLPLTVQLAGGDAPSLARLLDTDHRFAALRRQFLFLDRIQVIVLGDLVRWLGAGGVPFLLLKGLGLAETLYSNPLERVGVDIDLLVRTEDLERAGRILADEGFAAVHPDFYRHTHFHLPFVRTDGKLPITIEVHWDLSPKRSPVRFDPASFWDRGRERALRAGTVRVPPVDLEFAHLAWHAFNKGAVTLRDLGEIARVWGPVAGSADEMAIDRLSERSGVAGFVEQALALAGAFWGVASRSTRQTIERTWLQRRVAGRILEPRTVLRRGADRRPAERRLCYWSLLAPDRASLWSLFSEAAREAREPQADSTEPRGIRHAVGETGRLGLALLGITLRPPETPASPGPPRN